jgi:hypothetical protein
VHAVAIGSAYEMAIAPADVIATDLASHRHRPSGFSISSGYAIATYSTHGIAVGTAGVIAVGAVCAITTSAQCMPSPLA